MAKGKSEKQSSELAPELPDGDKRSIEFAVQKEIYRNQVEKRLIPFRKRFGHSLAKLGLISLLGTAGLTVASCFHTNYFVPWQKESSRRRAIKNEIGIRIRRAQNYLQRWDSANEQERKQLRKDIDKALRYSERDFILDQELGNRHLFSLIWELRSLTKNRKLDSILDELISDETFSKSNASKREIKTVLKDVSAACDLE
jgi:hypothetical protein